MRRPPPVLFVVLVLVVLGLLAQLIPLYTDWLWFEEVGYSQVFLSILSLRGTLFTGMVIAVLVFLWANPRSRRAPLHPTSSGSSRTSSGCPGVWSSSRSCGASCPASSSC